jgi:outer membrane receptor protein involved in Fe transport
LLVICLGGTVAHADELPRHFDIPASKASEGLALFAEQSGIPLIYLNENVRNKRTNRVAGSYTATEALEILLSGTGIDGSLNERRVLTVTVEKSGDDVESEFVAEIEKSPEGKGENVKKRSLIAGIVAVLAGTLAANAKGDQSDETAAKLEDVIVTADRRSESLQDVSMSVSVVVPDEFTSIGLNKLSDVLAYVPGLNIVRGGDPLETNLIIRGIGETTLTGTKTATVGVYLDNTPLTSNGPWGNGSKFSFDGLLGDVERIEVLRGPQGTLYGATSLAGAIRYITRKPALDEWRSYARVDLSDTKEGDLNQVYSAGISVPLIRNTLGMSVSGYHQDDGGLVDRAAASGEVLKANNDAFERQNGSFDVYYTPTDSLQLRARAMHQEAEYSGLGQVSFDPVTRQSLTGSLAEVSGFADTSLENNVFALTGEYLFEGGATLTSSSSWTEEQWKDSFQNCDLCAIADLFIGRPAGTTTSLTRFFNEGSNRFTQELQLASAANEQLEWIVGAYYTDEDTNSKLLITVQPGEVNWNTQQQPSNYKELAGFGNLRFFFTPEFDITLGLRQSETEMTFTPNSSSDVFNFPPTMENEVDDSVTTWSLDGRYRLGELVSLYGRAATGYRPASTNLPVTDGVTSLPLIVESDSLTSYELGVKGHSEDGNVSYDFAVWYQVWDDFQTVLALSPLVQGLGNAAGGVSGQGFEGSVTLRPIEGLSIISNVSYVNNTLDDDEPLLNGLAGQHVPGIPEWTFSSRARYDFRISSGLDAFAGAGISYAVSRRSTYTDDGALIPGVSDPAGSYDAFFNVPSDSYTLVDLNAGLIWGRYGLTLYVNNALNEEKWISAFGSTFFGSVFASGVPARPRTIGATLFVSF